MHEVSAIVSGVRCALAKMHIPALEALLTRGKTIEDVLATAIEDLLGEWPLPDDVLARLLGSDCDAEIPNSTGFGFDSEDVASGDMSRCLTITRTLVANIFRATRIQLLHALNSAVPYLFDAGTDLEANVAALVARSSSVMMQLAENISNDLPLALGDCEDVTAQKPRIYGRAIRAWTQLFPLESAMSVTWLSEQQRERVARLMEDVMGILGMHLHTKASGNVDFAALPALRNTGHLP